ncbi:MAG: aldo/keto reductase [Candidatus Dactylopiibacterium carminicum]|uniref:Aldo/keto reductase n=1 Tax=Candidatus Dactylopiibacterium carminicum TaxID=857335 RepID=A0A272EWE9_9RHOO|nr:aldo/keto reductase [Candidatus Dactylopiibacterium carminicum]KAF7600002.1 aldo/keto reductase [Candidatus Dactylopiibacterium carminicum]PAS94433.1 MAG: aldo/keto reductase [Candidatus Dactylopiibacterium carminicum]PAS96446.1 MAG: aldo/keto reductase [Candidatus Dactylopiibacterium carminicum]PAT00007.1 MAG: aldo/keto reductase [Candidatus Dactylopiibacterium carminicum]
MKKTRQIAGRNIGAIGLGCMNLHHGYGHRATQEETNALLHHALDLGVDFFDTATLYGFGTNEEAVGQALSAERSRFFLASKCGMQGVDGVRVIDGRPATLKATCEDSLRRLRTDHIDLYYLHRWDKSVPIEESVGALADLVREGKIGAIGLSEVSSATLRRAHAVHPVAALQSEYSLWSRDPERGVLQTCRELGVAFVAFSPLARGFLGDLRQVDGFTASDIRASMPRFAPASYAANLTLADAATAIASDAGCSLPQLALAWLLRDPIVSVIPGTTRRVHLEENLAADRVTLDDTQLAQLDSLFAPGKIQGERYNAASMAEIDQDR